MKNRTAKIHCNRMQDIHNLIPIELTDNDLNWILDWILSIGIGTIAIALQKNPSLTLHSLYLMTVSLPNDDSR